MIRHIVKEIEFLKIKYEEAKKDDLNIANDLIDTLTFNRHRCVGMAANMIGFSKRIIIFEDVAKRLVVMFNPTILKCSGEYHTEEGCLSLDGVRPTKRYKSIKVQYYDMDFKIKIKTYKDFQAQIIQHEIDHLNGIII